MSCVCEKVLSFDYCNLYDLPHRPERLWVRGTKKAFSLLDKIPDQGLAVVGSRNPLSESVSFVKSLMSSLEDSNLVVVSGVAHGIDTAAHQAAIRHQLPTIGVLGFGHDFPYTEASRTLRKSILENNGLLISEFPPWMPARPKQFLLRNRIIAHWSMATVVIEAAERSGTLNTARWARESDRPVFAVPCFPNDKHRKGNQKLIDDYQAFPLWGAHNLGSVWLDLASIRASQD